MPILKIFNGPAPTTVSFAAVTTGTALKTLLQIKPFNSCKILEWGISFDGAAGAAGIEVELIDTGTVFGTVTASADADISKVDGTDGAVASIQGLTLGTSATGYTCTSEGSITTTRLLDAQFVQPTNQFVYQFIPAKEARTVIGNAVRIRVKAAAAVNAICYMVLEF